MVYFLSYEIVFHRFESSILNRIVAENFLNCVFTGTFYEGLHQFPVFIAYI